MATNFQYPATCPMIDDLRDELRDMLDATIEALIPDTYPEALRKQLVAHWNQNFRQDLVDIVDQFRTINSDMRDACTEQLSAYDDELIEARNRIEELEANDG